MRRSSRGLLATAMVALLCGQIPAARAADAIKLLEQFNTLRDNYPDVIARNLQIVIDVTNSRTPEQEKRAVEDDNNQTIIELSDALGPVLGPIFAAAFDSTGLFSIDLPSTASALLGSYITVLSAPIAKEYFQNPRPFNESDQVKRADGSSGGGYSYPSGHTTFAYTQLLALGYMFPERYQEILTRASEYGNNRIVVGVHYPLDVIGGRIISEANVAELLANPLTRIGFDLGHTELENYFADKCGATAAECAHADPDQDIFSNHDKNKADYTYRLTYGFTGLFDTTVPMVVPDGAEYLIATRFPYLSTDQLREVLRTTSLPSGDALLDYQNWERLNLFAAADGYGAFDSDVTVTMNAADGGFSQYDSWQNDIAGPGTLTKAGSGWLDLTGDNSFGGLLVTDGTLRLTGDSALGSTRVTGGDLLVDGRLAETDAVTVASGGTLGGSGTIDAPVTIENGGTLSPGDGGAGTLTVGSLYLSPASFIEFDLGKPGVIGGGVNDLVVVNGDLTLDGVIDFNAANDTLAPGVYRLFDYSGALDDQGLTMGSLPSNVTESGLTVDSSNPSYVLLHVAGFGDQAVYYWNGTVPTPHDTVYGGSGTWDSTYTNWTNEAGSITSAWAGAHAAFGVTGGTVTIEGRQAFTGLSFYADGYSLVAGTDGGLDTATMAQIQVNTGLTALIAAPISGSGGIDKTDGGLLVLDGINSYAGGTRISGGTLQVSHDSALGDAAGGLTLDGGILRIAGTDYTATDRSIALGSNGGGFDIADPYGVFTVDDALSGTGGLLKTGEGYLVLTGANSYTGGTTVSGGTLIGDSLSLIGDIVDNATVAFDQAVDGVFSGRIGGVGSLIKTGTGLLVVTGSIAHTGGTTIEQGTLQIGDGGTTGSIANDITVNSTLAFARSDDYSFSDVIGGIGSVVQRGTGTLSLSGINSYSGGTTVEAGVLEVAGDTALGDLTGGLTLDGGTLRVLGTGFTGTSRDVVLGAAGGGFDIDDAGNVFTLAQALTGPGGLTKLGDGTLVLTAANSYGGGTTISAGTLVGDSTSLTGDILDNAALVFAQALDGVFAGRISGTGSVTKNGDGALTLSADNGFSSLTSTAGVLRLLGIDTIAGAVSITGGSLITDGTLHTTGGVMVGSGAELAGTGTIDGTVNIANGATLSPGGSAAGTLTVGTLNLAPASIVNFDLAQAGVIGGGINDYVVVNGDLTLDGILNVNATTGQLAPGVYRLFTYSGALDDQTLAYGTVPDNVTYAALGIDTATARQVSLVVDGVDPELSFWNGSAQTPDDTIHGGSGVWNADNTNWTNLEGSVGAAWAGKRAVFEVTGGTVTLVGQQAFSGLVFVADGYRLEAGEDGALVTSTSAEIQVNTGITAQIAAPITGSGGINKTDGGLLQLEGINSYAGGTLISGGTLEVAQDSALGDLAGGVTLNGGVLRIAGTDFASTTRSITLGDAGGGFDIADAGASFTVDQALSGAGALLKLGDGILRLTGANSYTGGTTISAGTLIGDTKSIVGTILDNAALAFEQAADGTFAGLVGGTGTVTVRGPGTLTLAGTFGQSGGTLIDGGSLRIGAGASLAGDVTDNGTLIFERSDDIAFGRTISGTGEVIKLGSGLLEFTGTNSYTGDTLLQAGTLSVTGSIAGSTVRLASGTLLTGDGAVGGIDAASGSTVDPAATTGTASLSVNGDIKLAAGSTLKIDFDSLGLHDQLKATGSAAIASGALLDVEGLEVVGTSYTILTANQGVSGRFDVLPDDYVFLDEVVAYDPNKVTVSLSRNDTAFASAATTPNGRAAADAVEKLGLGNALYDAVVKADMAEAAKVFATLSGEIYASAAGIMIDEVRQIQTAVIDRLQHQLLDTADAMVAAIPFGAASPTASAGTTEQAEPDRNNAFWTAAYGAWGHRDAATNAAAADSSSSGVLFGADTETSGGWTIGLAGGIGQVSADADAIAASADVNSYSLALYGGKRFGRLGLRFGAAYTWQNVDTTRTVTLPATTERLNASYDARTAQVFGDIGYGFKLTRHLIAEPFGDLSYLNYSSDGASETGGSAALTVDGQDYSSAYTALGLRVGGSRDIVGGRKLTAGGSVAWRHAYGDTDPEVSVNFGSDPASSFTSSGLAVARDTMALDAGVDLRLIGGISVGVNYSGQVSSATQEHGVQANVKIRF